MSTSDNPLLRIKGIETFYGRSQALFGMGLEIKEGEVATLIGRNGMGKTTTVRSVMGLVPVAKGEVTFKGQRLDQMPPHQAARMGLGLVPEGRHIFPNLTVTENLIATAGNRSKRPDPWTLDRILELFPSLEARRNSMGNLLSGGEQQMLAVGRALMTNPDLLILDEATEGLAPLIRHEIWSVLSKLKSDGQSILVIDKNVADLTRIADRHFVIEKGAAVWSGSSKDLTDNPDLVGRYLGV